MPLRPFNRRTLIRGAGTVAIALPFLEEMSSRGLFAAEPEPPVRAMTLFFGLGVLPMHQAELFAGPLGPLEPFANKLSLFLGNVNMTTEAQGGAHPNGGTVCFTGAGGDDRGSTRGASIEQVIKKHAYPTGTPTAFGTIAAATFFRRNGLFKTVRCWDENGAPAAMPYERPEETFDALFGNVTTDPGPADPAAERALRLQRSVLDTTVEQYRHYQSDASNLSVASRARVADHLERIREMERRIFPEEGMGNGSAISCTNPTRPVNPNLEFGIDRGLDGTATEATAADFQAAFRLNAELFVTGMRCDLFRFGNLQFESPGGHARLTGTYEAPGVAPFAFDPTRSNHQTWHEGDLPHIWHHSHYLMSSMAYVLGLLDDGAYLDENSQTLLDNIMLMMGTEQGDGRGHDVDGVFHAVSSGNGRFQVGQIFEQPTTGVDLYSAVTQAYGVPEVMGDAAAYNGGFTPLLA